MEKTAKILRDNNAEIMKIWQNQVVQEVLASKESDSIALYNQLPDLINDIARLMIRYDKMEGFNKDEKYIEILKTSEEHGKQRSTKVYYTAEQIVHEYIIFHRTLSEFLISHNGYSEKVSDLLKYVIETSILKSVGSFSRSIQDMQEKLIGTLAHDIRNPLAAAQLSLEMMKQDKTGEWTNKTRIAAQRSVKKAINLIEGLMNGITVKSGEGMLLTFESSDLLKEMKFVHAESKEVYTREINLEYNAKKIIGIFDKTAVKRLVDNLIGNAIKYGSIDKPITISIEDEEDAVAIKVHNWGNPIPLSKQEQIFKFMGSAKRDKKPVSASWGMGLTLTQIVAEAHGGDINLVSDEKTGTTFTVNLIKQFNEVGKRRAKLTFVLDNI
ncbi:two-component sensor histidine kinase [Psychroflexus torquis ATCC 700755]|uniref:histidine kinase n=1 Tax=Psychroflexus torquis (strain ATCC 700755 / CIP 106069 / ACAM 623) TaxID=313595 RepID=K4IYJ5_PSYTT|nr:HAMP domain-containing sensor histidine kinase [Psychroflexus torquis]AFU70535.1 two-component sensor histidine kinase [Psychroflexus torquis ATCC 700755]